MEGVKTRLEVVETDDDDDSDDDDDNETALPSSMIESLFFLLDE